MTVTADLTARIAELADAIKAHLAEDESTVYREGDPPNGVIAWLTYREPDGSMSYTTVAHSENFDDVWVADGKELRPPASVLVVYNPVHVVRRVKATRDLVADILAEPHHYNEGDPWYSCRQAVRDDEAEPGSGCVRDDAGGPCDCGRDERVARRLEIIASEWEGARETQR